MKKFLTFLLIILFWNTSGFSKDFNWLKKLETPHPFVYGASVLDLVQNKIPKTKIYLGMTKNKEKLSLFEHFKMVLSTRSDPDEFDRVDSKVFAFSGCRYQSCPEKGFIWIDKDNEIIIGSILHFFINDSGYKPVGDILIFSNQVNEFKDIPNNYNVDFENWISSSKINYEELRFIGSDNEIMIINK